MKNILIAWGDGETSSLTSRPGIPAPPAFGEQDDPLPAGTYQLTHAYAEPEDRMPFEYYVLLRVQDWSGGEEINFVRIVLTPRYRITNYQTRVRLTGPCDPHWESTSEFDITQVVDGTKRRQWHWEPSNNFFSEAGFFLLENSHIFRELTLADGYVAVTFIFTETDPPWGSDTVLRFGANLSAVSSSESVSANVVEWGGGDLFGTCDLIARYDREVSLIVPLPENGQQVVFASSL
jgi:hypothetical protein